MTLPLPRAVLFDLDGTLADTAPDLAGAMNAVRAMRGLPPTPYELLRPVASAGARGLIGASFGLKPGDEGYEELRIAFLDTYEAAIAEQIAARAAAKAAKNFPEADRIRQSLLAQGITLKDGPAGTTWERT